MVRPARTNRGCIAHPQPLWKADVRTLERLCRSLRQYPEKHYPGVQPSIKYAFRENLDSEDLPFNGRYQGKANLFRLRFGRAEWIDTWVDVKMNPMCDPLEKVTGAIGTFNVVKSAGEPRWNA